MVRDLASPCISIDPAELRARYLAVRQQTVTLCEPLAVEDFNLQSMAEASPVKWHLAHTSWFFETFVLLDAKCPNRSFEPYHPAFRQLYNSYYAAIGERFERGRRGLLSRPSVGEIFAYRTFVDDAILALFRNEVPTEILERIELGLHHEQQHQELILTDIKHAFGMHPLRPMYALNELEREESPSAGCRWILGKSGVRHIGFGGDGFRFDNETPRHRVFLEPFEIASRLVTNGEYREFIEDGGYEEESLWLAAGWEARCRNDWLAPLYWEQEDGECNSQFTLRGTAPISWSEPVCHVSYFEADAFARWRGATLPSEFEWESNAESVKVEGCFLESGRLHPEAAPEDCAGLTQMFGDVWEWTRSGYEAYPGYRADAGALGEYNGKFMSGQHVLRGGSCVTPRSHIRLTYRNFFPPDARWQFTGIRLARSIGGRNA